MEKAAPTRAFSIVFTLFSVEKGPFSGFTKSDLVFSKCFVIFSKSFVVFSKCFVVFSKCFVVSRKQPAKCCRRLKMLILRRR